MSARALRLRRLVTITLLLFFTPLVQGQHSFHASIPSDPTRQWIAHSLHTMHEKAGTYSFKQFVYAAAGTPSDLDSAFISALQKLHPNNAVTTVAFQTPSGSELLEQYPQAQIFSLTFSTRVDASGMEHEGMVLCLSMENAIGHCASVDLSTLLCHPTDVMATISVKNLLSNHALRQDFWSMAPKDPKQAAIEAESRALRSITEKKIHVSASDLHFDPNKLSSLYSGPMEVSDKTTIYDLIRSNANALVLLAPNDDCDLGSTASPATARVVLYDCATGSCIAENFAARTEHSGSFGFDEEHLRWLEERAH